MGLTFLMDLMNTCSLNCRKLQVSWGSRYFLWLYILWFLHNLSECATIEIELNLVISYLSDQILIYNLFQFFFQKLDVEWGLHLDVFLCQRLL